MKLNAVFTTLGIISLHKDFFAVAKSVNSISGISENNFNPCNGEENCLSDEGKHLTRAFWIKNWKKKQFFKPAKEKVEMEETVATTSLF